MVYCESNTDEEVLKGLDGSKSIVLAGCPGCANTCMYLRNEPDGSPMLTISPKGFTAVSMQAEMDRLALMLSARGFKVRSWLGKYPTGILCVPDERSGRKKIIKNCQGYDAVVTLCCDGGTRSVSKIMNGMRVVPAMKAAGIVSGLMKSNLTCTKMSIDRDSVDIVRLTPGN